MLNFTGWVGGSERPLYGMWHLQRCINMPDTGLNILIVVYMDLTIMYFIYPVQGISSQPILALKVPIMTYSNKSLGIKI